MTVLLVETVKRFYGLSTDVKPTLTAKDVGSTFYEWDTGDGFIWNGGAWVAV